MNKMTLLATSIALVLAGCGSDSGSNSNNNSRTTTIKAIDGYLAHADVYAFDLKHENDVNAQSACSAEPTQKVGTTDETGALTIDKDDIADKALCVVAVPNQTIDLTRGVITEAFRIAAPTGYSVVTPLTDLVAKASIAEPSSDLASAEEHVAALLADLGISAQNLNSDYIESKDVAVEKLAEILVDNLQAGKDLQDGSIELLAEAIAEAQADENVDFEHYAPVVGEDGSVTANYRPQTNFDDAAAQEKATNLTVAHGALFTLDAGDWFKDQDGNSEGLTYQWSLVNEDEDFTLVEVAYGEQDALLIDNGEMDVIAGIYELQVVATDPEGAASYPVKVTITVTAPEGESAPTVSQEAVEAVQAEFDGLTLRAGQQMVATTVDLSSVFNDADGPVSYSSEFGEGIPGVSSYLESDGTLELTGTPIIPGEFEIITVAYDNNLAFRPAKVVWTVKVEGEVIDAETLISVATVSDPTLSELYSSGLGRPLRQNNVAYVGEATGKRYAAKDKITDETESTYNYVISDNKITLNLSQLVDEEGYEIEDIAEMEYITYLSDDHELALVTHIDGSFWGSDYVVTKGKLEPTPFANSFGLGTWILPGFELELAARGDVTSIKYNDLALTAKANGVFSWSIDETDGTLKIVDTETVPVGDGAAEVEVIVHDVLTLTLYRAEPTDNVYIVTNEVAAYTNGSVTLDDGTTLVLMEEVKP